MREEVAIKLPLRCTKLGQDLTESTNFRAPLGPKFLKSIGRRPPKPPKPNAIMGKMGGVQPRFSPELSPGNFEKQKKIPQGPWRELCENIWVENNFHWFPVVWVAWGPQLSTFIGKTTQPPRPRKPL